MPYNKTTGIITAPIGIADVSAALSENSSDVGTLCRSTKIKPWARHKPQRSSAHITNDEVWGGEYGNFGFGIVSDGLIRSITGNNITTLIEHYTTDGWNGWRYLAPRLTGILGITDRYRLLDFDGYNHNASPEYSMATQLYATEGNALSITPHQKSFANDATILRIGDLATMQDYDGNGTPFHFGAFVATTSGELKDMAVSDTPITSGVSGVTLDKVASLPVGEYKVYCFLATKSGTYADLVGSTFHALPFPNIAPATLTIAEKKQPVVITATASQSSVITTSVTISITITNNQGSDLTLNGNYIRYYATGSGAYTEKALSDITISAGNSKTLNAIVSNVSVSGSSRWMYSLGGAYTASDLMIRLAASAS